MKRKQIRVGHQIVTGSVCDQCLMETVIFPESLMADHIKHHGEQQATVSRNKRGGRPVGGKNVMQMSSTGVEYGQGILRAR